MNASRDGLNMSILIKVFIAGAWASAPVAAGV